MLVSILGTMKRNRTRKIKRKRIVSPHFLIFFSDIEVDSFKKMRGFCFETLKERHDKVFFKRLEVICGVSFPVFTVKNIEIHGFDVLWWQYIGRIRERKRDLYKKQIINI